MDIKHFPEGYHPSSSQQYAIPNIVDSLSKYKFIICLLIIFKNDVSVKMMEDKEYIRLCNVL